MKVLLCGGTFGTLTEKKESGILKKIYSEFLSPASEIDIINGGDLIQIPNKLTGYNLILWMANINNEVPKSYPQKDPGTVLICSKVMREGYTRIDSLSRIFKLHGNAVLEIYKEDSHVKFIMVDALGNEWYEGDDIQKLVQSILKFYIFTSESRRIQTTQVKYFEDEDTKNLKGLIEENKRLQGIIMTKCGDRFFGNLSTRCTKLFPTFRGLTTMYVSPRNINKESIQPEDMIVYNSEDKYIGENKPSVDSPTQIRLYSKYPNINFMIHGHATFEDATTTENYRLCGDIREVDEILNIVHKDTDWFIINLKNHGFLIGANNLNTLRNIIIEIEKGITYGKIKITNQKE